MGSPRINRFCSFWWSAEQSLILISCTARRKAIYDLLPESAGTALKISGPLLIYWWQFHRGRRGEVATLAPTFSTPAAR